MDLKNKWTQFWDKYMKSPVEKIDVSNFPTDDIVRYHMVFSGLVQGVGFRYELWTIAQKLQLTGFVENLPNGDVYAELQGPRNKILFSVESMKSIPRIQIEKLEMYEMDIKKETDFEMKN